MLIAGYFLVRYIGINFSLSSIFLMLLLLLHSAAYFYYVNVWGPKGGYLDFFLEAARGQPVLPTLTAALGVMFVLVCVGMRLADLVGGTNGRKMRVDIERWKLPEPYRDAADAPRIALITSLSLILVLIPVAVFDNQISNVLSYFGSFEREADKIDLRRDLGGSSAYLYNLLASNFLPFVAFCSLASRRASRRPLGPLIWLFLIMVLLSKLALLSKGPVAIFIIQVFVLRKMGSSLQLPVKTLVTIAAVAIGAFIAIVWLVNLGGYEGDLIEDILIYRTLMIPNESLVEYFSAIPYSLDFSWGQQLSWVAGLFRSEPRLPTFWLVGEVHRGSLGSTTTAMFIADAWADFAWFGIVFFSLFSGFYLRSLDIRLLARGRPTIWKLGGLALGHFGIYVAMNTSFMTALLTGGLLMVIPFAIWLPKWLGLKHSASHYDTRGALLKNPARPR